MKADIITNEALVRALQKLNIPHDAPVTIVSYEHNGKVIIYHDSPFPRITIALSQGRYEYPIYYDHVTNTRYIPQHGKRLTNWIQSIQW